MRATLDSLDFSIYNKTPTHVAKACVPIILLLEFVIFISFIPTLI